MSGQNIWFKADIKNTLHSLYHATLQTGVDGDYRRGYEAALLSVALAFGIEVETTQLHTPRRNQAETPVLTMMLEGTN